MRAIPLVLISAGIFSLVARAAEAPPAAWKWEQAVTVEQPGLVRLELPPATLDASQPVLADLRVVSPDGVAVAWALLDMAGSKGKEQLRAANEVKAVLEDGTTVISGRHERGAIMAVTLESPARDFLKSASVEVSEDGRVWRRVVQGEVVFRQAGEVERLRLSFARVSSEYVRVILDDSRSAPVAFVGLQVTLAEEMPELVAHPATILSRDELRGETRLVLGLGGKNLHLGELGIDVGDPLFSRACSVALPAGPAGGLPERVIAEAGLFRVGGPGGGVATHLAIPIHARIPSDTLVVRVRNGDSPPLEVRGLEAGRYRDALVFYAGQAGDWKLLTGNAYAAYPEHDQAALRAESARGAWRELRPGPLLERAGHEEPAAVPGRIPTGLPLDVAGWQYRRQLEGIRKGVVRMELDAVTLAHLTHDGDLRDLRLVQNGRQLPWLEERGRVPRELRPAVALEAVPKQATVSRWVLTLPADGVPLRSLTANSPDPLFARHFRVSMEVRDSLGNLRLVRLGETAWTRRPGANPGSERLLIDLGNQRTGGRLLLETDNGDNPPVRLEEVVLHYEAPLLVALLPSMDPAFLYYGNPWAEAPSYDLHLVREDLRRAAALAVVLGPEETLLASKRRGPGADAGSPWLWAVLAGVVAVLLVVVARLLPSAAVSDPPADG